MDKTHNFRSLFDLSKARILVSLKEQPQTISQLSVSLNLSRRNLAHHLRKLEGDNLVYSKVVKSSQGAPRFWNLTEKAQPLPKFIIDLFSKSLSQKEKKGRRI